MEGCFGPTHFCSRFAPVVECVHLYHTKQIGFKNPVPGLRSGDKYVVRITASNTGDWILNVDEINCHINFRPMSKQELKFGMIALL